MRRALLIVMLLAPALATAQPPEDSPAARALAWLPSASQAPSPPYFVEAAAQAGHDPKRWPDPAHSSFSQLAEYQGLGGVYYSYERIAHAAGTSGYDPRNVNGVDYVAKVRAGFSNGQFGDTRYVNDDIWAILALRAAGVPPDDEQIRASVLVIKASAAPDGGWAYSLPALRGDPDITGQALAALRAAGEPMGQFANAHTFLDSTFNADDGGHDSNVPNSHSNCQSTVWALHGYAALGVPQRDATLQYVRALQNDDGGLGITATSASDGMCTAEAIPLLAGVRYPLPSYMPLTAPRPEGNALANVTLSVPAPFERAVWSFDDITLAGRSVTRTFPAAGTYHYRVLAEGPGIRSRAEGDVKVLSARPMLGTFASEVDAFRRANVTLDLRSARDPDGTIERFEIDWGDGNATSGKDRLPSHAYLVPGNLTLSVSAIDNAGTASETTRVIVHVVNRAPVLAPLPARVVADRLNGATIDVRASDPDEDALVGTGARSFRFATLGNHTASILVRDPFDGEARTNVTIEVVNLPPRVTIETPSDVIAGQEILLVANATDPDGPAPALAWSLGPRASFAVGDHAIRVSATDADGAIATAIMTIHARDPDSAAAPEARRPEIGDFEAALAEGALRVSFDATGDALVRWQSDVGDGERALDASPATIGLPGATWATATLEVARDGVFATRGSGLLVPPASTSPARREPDAARAPPSPVVLEPIGEVALDGAGEPVQAAAIMAGQPGSREETPLPWWWALACVPLAAMLRRRGA